MEEISDEDSESVDGSHSEEESIIVEHQLTMTKKSNYDDNSILFDTRSIFSVIKKPNMVVNLRNIITTMNGKSNGGNE